jgi:hypothetical protein
MRCGVRRRRLDEPFLFARTNCNDDLVRREGRKSVADGETDVRLPGNGIDGLARELLGGVFGDPLRMTERFLVVGEPVEGALSYDRHHDLDRVSLPDMLAQDVVRMFDGADDEDVLAHDANVSQRGARLAAKTDAAAERVSGRVAPISGQALGSRSAMPDAGLVCRDCGQSLVETRGLETVTSPRELGETRTLAHEDHERALRECPALLDGREPEAR